MVLDYLATMQRVGAHSRIEYARQVEWEMGSDLGRFDRSLPDYLDELVDLVASYGEQARPESRVIAGIAAGFIEKRIGPMVVGSANPIQRNAVTIGHALAELDYYRARIKVWSYSFRWDSVIIESARSIIRAVSMSINATCGDLLAGLPSYETVEEWIETGYAQQSLLLIMCRTGPMTSAFMANQLNPFMHVAAERPPQAIVEVVEAQLHELKRQKLVIDDPVGIHRITDQQVPPGAWFPSNAGRLTLLKFAQVQAAKETPDAPS